jgi:hypothetical protein
LELEFNSLDAQRDTCEAYIKSQASQGWKVLPQHYDDPAYSGGNLDRPALRKLLADIEAGRIDVVVVYKIDRLTRSLADFAKLVEAFDARSISFVAVTQQFNTTTSMGRLTLNVLLSFLSSKHLPRPLAQSLPGDIQHRNQKNSDAARGNHTNENRRAHIMSCNFGRAFRPHERRQTKNECDRCHHHRPETHSRSQCRGLLDARALLALLLGKFDDQDAILCRERNQNNQANLRIEVQG